MTRDRHLVLAGVHNLRDLGGYPTADGRVTRWRRLFRGDALHRVEPGALGDLGIRTVVDLRSPDDPQLRPFVAPGVETVGIAIAQGSMRSMIRHDAGPPAEVLAGMYAELAAGSRSAIGEVLRQMAAAERLPLVFHCSMGKDRTGVVAGVLLALLGVPDAVVADDYALTTQARDGLVAGFLADDPSLADAMAQVPEAMFASPAEAMLIFLDRMRQDYGSVEGYAAAAGVDESCRSALRELLLERP